jgi:hypothetical protein
MTTHNDPDRDRTTPLAPEAGEKRVETGAVEEIVVAEPSSVEPGTLEPVVARVVRPTGSGEGERSGSGHDGWTRPDEGRDPEPESPNPYVVRTTVPPMNPHSTGAPLAGQGEDPVAAPQAGGSSLPGGEIYSSAPTPVYTAPPAQPARQGNRLFGTIVALIGTVVFGVVYAAIASLFFVFSPGVDDAVSTLLRFLANFAFIVPVAFFAIAAVLLVLVLNRAGWWAYIIGGFIVAAIVYAGAIVGAYLSVQGWTMSQSELGEFLRSLTMDPLPLTAAIVAREVSVWTGAWIASRGRKVKARNQSARADYDKTLAEAPTAAPQGQPVW